MEDNKYKDVRVRAYLHLKHIKGREPTVQELAMEWGVREADVPTILLWIQKTLRSKSNVAKKRKPSPEVNHSNKKRARIVKWIMGIGGLLSIAAAIAINFAGYIDVYGPVVAVLFSAMFPIVGAASFVTFFFFKRNIRWLFFAGWIVISLYSLVTVPQGLNAMFSQKSMQAEENSSRYDIAQDQITRLKAEITDVENKKSANKLLWDTELAKLKDHYATQEQQTDDKQGYINTRARERNYNKIDTAYSVQIADKNNILTELQKTAPLTKTTDFFSFLSSALGKTKVDSIRFFIQLFPAFILDLINAMCMYAVVFSTATHVAKKEDEYV